MATLPTVRVVAPDGGPLVINESDFDPMTHTLFFDAPEGSTESSLRSPEAPVSGKGAAASGTLFTRKTRKAK